MKDFGGPWASAAHLQATITKAAYPTLAIGDTATVNVGDAPAVYTWGKSNPNAAEEWLPPSWMTVLRDWQNLLTKAEYAPVNLAIMGHSLVFGANAAATDAEAEVSAFASLLRKKFARLLGAPEAGMIDLQSTQWTLAGASTATGSTGPACRGLTVNPGAGFTATITLPTCTYIDIYSTESNGSDGLPLTGAYAYSVDGGADVTVPYTATNGPKKVTIGPLTQGPHTLVLKKNDGTNAVYLGTVRYHSGRGVCVSRHGKLGWSVRDLLGRPGATNNTQTNAAVRERLKRGFAFYGSDTLNLLMCPRNDWKLQIAQSLTPAITAADVGEIVAYTAAQGIRTLVVNDPADQFPTDVAVGSYSQSDFDTAVKAATLANGGYWLSVKDAWGTYATAQASGLMDGVDRIHPPTLGHADIARFLFNELSLYRRRPAG